MFYTLLSRLLLILLHGGGLALSSALDSINEVALRQPRLLLGWVTVMGINRLRT